MPIDFRRREFIAALGGAAFGWPLAARAQQSAGRNARIGLLQTSRDNPVVGRGYPAFLDELKKSGFSAGQNLTIEVVRTDQDSQRLFAETADLVRSNVEVLVAEGSEIVLKAALAASRTIPIVILATNYDPIAHGYVKSLAQPGGNITGIVFFGKQNWPLSKWSCWRRPFPTEADWPFSTMRNRPTSLPLRSVRRDRCAWTTGR